MFLSIFVRAENVVLRAQEQPSLPVGEYVRVSIADQGAGIAKDVLPKIFDPYFSTKHRGDQKGMGLGLTICHAVIQKHGGAIAVKSEVGVGTTFDIYLPAARNLSGGDKAPAPAVILRHGRVLVMDDEEGVREVLGQTLEGMGASRSQTSPPNDCSMSWRSIGSSWKCKTPSCRKPGKNLRCHWRRSPTSTILPLSAISPLMNRA